MVAGHWSLAIIFPTQPSAGCPEHVWVTHWDAQHALLAGLTCRSSEGQQAVLLLHYQVRSLCTLITEMGKTETLDQLPVPHLQAAGRCMHALPLPSHPSHSHMFSQVCRAGTKITLFMSTKLTQPSTLGIIRHRCVVS